MIWIAAALLATASPAEPPPPPAVVAALDAWGTCINDGVHSVDRALSPDRAAQIVLDRCAPQQAALLAEHARWIDSSGLPEREKDRARRVMTESLVSLRRQVARGIRRMRD